MEQGSLVEICRSFDPGEAHIIRGALESVGIPCFILDEHHNTIAWHYQVALGGMRLAVPESFLEDAKNIITQTNSENRIPSENLPWLPQSASAQAWSIIAILLYYLAGFFIPQRRKGIKDKAD